MKKKTVRDNGKILSGICFALIIGFARYLPVVALVPLTLLYLGIDETQKYTIIFLGTFFQLVLMVCDTVSGVDRNMINAAKTLGASKWQISGWKKVSVRRMI